MIKAVSIIVLLAATCVAFAIVFLMALAILWIVGVVLVVLYYFLWVGPFVVWDLYKEIFNRNKS